MTRDEALKLLTPIATKNFPASPNIDRVVNAEVDMLVALGILKLDEPVSAMDRLWQSNSSCLMTRLDLKRALDKAGLKIVEK